MSPDLLLCVRSLNFAAHSPTIMRWLKDAM